MSTSPIHRQAIFDLLATFNRALHVHEIASRLGISEGDYAELHRVLDEMAFDGSVNALVGQRFRLTRAQTEQRGTQIEGVISVNPRGFGFVSSVGLADDIFVPAESLMGALHGDTVKVRIATRSRRGPEGEVVAVVKRRNARIAGVLCLRGKSAWIEPDDNRVRGPIVLTGQKVQAIRELGGKDGDAAVALITRFPETPDENPEGELSAVLGAPGEPKVEVAKVLVREAIAEEHPEAALKEALAFGNEVAQDALEGRTDLSHLPLPTIDPETARDHDDAVWVERHESGGYTAWIAIADVSHYVKPNTALDAEALARGNSVYLPDRAIPMLPPTLSSNLCSLVPGVVRLCLALKVELAENASIKRYSFFEAFMRSAAKLTYPGVARALGFSAEAPRSPEAEAMREDLQVMWELAGKLRTRRMRRGALDFDLPEAEITLEPESGMPTDVQKRSHDPGVAKAYHLIEELMLLANECAAQFLIDHDMPAVFRNHAPPDETKLIRFASMCDELGVEFDSEDALDPKKLSVFLKKIAAHPKKHVLHMLLLRAMKQAVYDVANIGHFGLASKAYLHFTSPIRRYPDLLVHRAVRAVLRKENIDRSDKAMEARKTACMRASDCERRAMEVEREVGDLYRALFMRTKIGAIFEGMVTGFSATGLYVAVDAPFVDVFVRLEELGPDTYELAEDGLRVLGKRSGDRISLGDSMLVSILDVAILRRMVLGRRLVDPTPQKFGGGKQSRSGRASKRSEKTVSDKKGGRRKKK